MNVDRILLLAREYASAYSLKDQSEVSRTWMNLKRALQEAAAPQQAEPVGEVRSETCHYSMMPDRICNKCGRVHGYSHPTAAPQRADAEMIRTEAWQSITDELAHAAYLRGIEEGKRQAAAPQQAEPVAQIGWSDEFGNLFPMAAWKPAQRTHHDSHKAAWRPVFLHPPAAEVQRLRDAAKKVIDAYAELYTCPEEIIDLRRALEGGE